MAKLQAMIEAGDLNPAVSTGQNWPAVRGQSHGILPYD